MDSLLIILKRNNRARILVCGTKNLKNYAVIDSDSGIIITDAGLKKEGIILLAEKALKARLPSRTSKSEMLYIH